MTLYLAGQMTVASTGFWVYSCSVTGLVCGWTSQPPDYSRAELEPGHRAASESAVGSKASRPVTGAIVGAGSSYVPWEERLVARLWASGARAEFEGVGPASALQQGPESLGLASVCGPAFLTWLSSVWAPSGFHNLLFEFQSSYKSIFVYGIPVKHLFLWQDVCWDLLFCHIADVAVI